MPQFSREFWAVYNAATLLPGDTPMLDEYLPQTVNTSNWLCWYTLNELEKLDEKVEIVLPVCSLGTAPANIASLGDLVLPPLYHEALDPSLKERLVQQILECVPYHACRSQPDRQAAPTVRVHELPPSSPPTTPAPQVLAFSVDTAVEEHGPHLPLATDTIQSYSVLRRLQEEMDGLLAGPPLEYGQLTWGLPFGYSVDLTAELLTDYVARYTNAMLDWLAPEAIYVVDVHGSIVHRAAIVAGLKQSKAQHWAFRWLHEPLAEFASARKDQHAGGVETALVEHVSRSLLDPLWWPARIDELADGQMAFDLAIEMSGDLAAFAATATEQKWNGIVGDINNYHQLDAELMFNRMLSLAREDVAALVSGRSEQRQNAGEQLW